MGFPTVIPSGCKCAIVDGNPGQVQDRAGLLDAYQAGDTTKSGCAAHPHVMKITGAIPCDQRIVPVLVFGVAHDTAELAGIGGGNDFCSGGIVINRSRKKRGPRPVNDNTSSLSKIDHPLGLLVPRVRIGGWIVYTPLVAVAVVTTAIPHVAGIVAVHGVVDAVQLAARGAQDNVTDQPTIGNRKGAMPWPENTVTIGLAAQ